MTVDRKAENGLPTDIRSVTDGDTDTQSGNQQLQAYARDLARLYRMERQVSQSLEERQCDLEMLIEIHGRLARCLDRDSLIGLLIDTFLERLGVLRALVYVATPSLGGYSFAAGHAHEPAVAPVDPPPVPADHPLYGRFTNESQEFIVADSGDQAYAEWFAKAYPATDMPAKVLFLPLPGRTRLVGCIALDSRAGEPITPERRSIATLLARQSGLLLENVILYEQSRTELATVRELYDENQQRLAERTQFSTIVGANHRMRQIFSLLRTVADVDVPVLILGETGTGKELVAQALHYASGRKNQPFVSVNCATLPSELVESELFGHEKGAFTGAHQRRVGKVEMAEGGTLFLDEIGEMPANLQAKLLRFLQERVFERVGGSRPIPARVRIVAATNQDIDRAVRDGRLRMDLVYRLNTITVTLPPLRERGDDIPLLVNRFIEEANQHFGCDIADVDPAVYSILLGHRWPGNVRELKNVIDRACILTQRGTILAETVQFATGETTAPSAAAEFGAHAADVAGDRSLTDLKQEVVEQFERTYLDRLLREHSGNITKAASAARIDKKNFIDKMRRYGIERKAYLVDD